jgi:hypothetical protein
MAEVISYILSNIPAVCFALALIVAFLRHDGRSYAARLLDWMLLLPVGVGGVWAGFFHITFPAMVAQSIGWQPSPFQFEIGVADAAIGVAGIVSFWRALPFKAAVVLYIVLFNFGVAVGHVREALGGNFAPNNFGLLLVITLAEMVLLPLLLRAASRKP